MDRANLDRAAGRHAGARIGSKRSRADDRDADRDRERTRPSPAADLRPSAGSPSDPPIRPSRPASPALDDRRATAGRRGDRRRAAEGRRPSSGAGRCRGRGGRVDRADGRGHRARRGSGSGRSSGRGGSPGGVAEIVAAVGPRRCRRRPTSPPMPSVRLAVGPAGGRAPAGRSGASASRDRLGRVDIARRRSAGWRATPGRRTAGATGNEETWPGRASHHTRSWSETFGRAIGLLDTTTARRIEASGIPKFFGRPESTAG